MEENSKHCPDCGEVFRPVKPYTNVRRGLWDRGHCPNWIVFSSIRRICHKPLQTSEGLAKLASAGEAIEVIAESIAESTEVKVCPDHGEIGVPREHSNLIAFNFIARIDAWDKGNCPVWITNPSDVTGPKVLCMKPLDLPSVSDFLSDAIEGGKKAGGELADALRPVEDKEAIWEGFSDFGEMEDSLSDRDESEAPPHYLRISSHGKGGSLMPYSFVQAAWMSAPWFRKMMSRLQRERVDE